MNPSVIVSAAVSTLIHLARRLRELTMYTSLSLDRT